jgi:hypothetical protein
MYKKLIKLDRKIKQCKWQNKCCKKLVNKTIAQAEKLKRAGFMTSLIKFYTNI